MTLQAGKTNWCNLNRNKTKIPSSKLLFLCLKVLSGHNNTENISNYLSDFCSVQCGDVTSSSWQYGASMATYIESWFMENNTLATDGTNKASLKILKPNWRLPNFPLILFLTFEDCSWTQAVCLGYSWGRGRWYQYFQSTLCSESNYWSQNSHVRRNTYQFPRHWHSQGGININLNLKVL